MRNKEPEPDSISIVKMESSERCPAPRCECEVASQFPLSNYGTDAIATATAATGRRAV